VVVRLSVVVGVGVAVGFFPVPGVEMVVSVVMVVLVLMFVGMAVAMGVAVGMLMLVPVAVMLVLVAVLMVVFVVMVMSVLVFSLHGPLLRMSCSCIGCCRGRAILLDLPSFRHFYACSSLQSREILQITIMCYREGRLPLCCIVIGGPARRMPGAPAAPAAAIRQIGLLVQLLSTMLSVLLIIMENAWSCSYPSSIMEKKEYQPCVGRIGSQDAVRTGLQWSGRGCRFDSHPEGQFDLSRRRAFGRIPAG
jgi:hypothetical protein